MTKFFDTGYFLPFISGYRDTRVKGTSETKIKSFLKSVNEDLRATIENAAPAFFYYKPEVYSQALKDFIQELALANTTSVDYISYLKTSKGNVYREDKEFKEVLNSCLAAYKYPDFTKVNLDIRKEIDLQQFSKIVSNNFNLIQEKITVSKNPRLLITAAGRKIRREFAKITPCVLKNPETLVTNFNVQTEKLVVGSTFSNLRDSINLKLTPLILQSFENAGIVLSNEDKKSGGFKFSRFTVGSIVVFGHTGAKGLDDAGVSQPIGIITPWVQQLMLLAGQNSQAIGGLDIINSFYTQSGHAQYSIQFTKNVSDDVSTLLQAQMAFIVPLSHPNNKKLITSETSASESIIKNIFGDTATYRTIRKTLIGNILSRANLFKIITGLKFSPTILQSLETGFISTIKTGKFKKSKSKGPEAKQVFDVNKVISLQLSNTVKKINAPKITTKSKSKPQELKFTTTNLTALQNLLDATLVQQVKNNMGTGNRRDILNLRTGRFAESVEVTRLSESRQGMITAFYTYMKNPYATFSAGGRQEFPRSRDPKLLISKSIREIAAQQVSNRLRSVLV